MIMKLLVLVIFMGISLFALSEADPLPTVPRVDLARYVGKWYEVARYPNRFEKDCVSDVTAEYAQKDGKISVVNTCRKQDGSTKQSKGSAKVVDEKTNAKLKVTFFWPFYGQYWILDLAPDYSYAVVGEPSRKYLWILSRTPTLEGGMQQKIHGKLRELGYDPAKLVEPKHTQNVPQTGT